MVDEVITFNEQFYILASSSVADENTHVLKHGDTFLITDRHGDIRPLGFEEQGLFYEGTRFLSRLTLRLAKKNLLLLSSRIKDDNGLLRVDLTNSDVAIQDDEILLRGTIYLERTIFLWQGCYHERIRIIHYGLVPVNFEFSMGWDADFVDIFEVRGMKREKRGEKLEPLIEDSQLTLRYLGLDGVERRSFITLFPKPETLTSTRATYNIQLMPHSTQELCWRLFCESGTSAIKELPSFQQAFEQLSARPQQTQTSLKTANGEFNNWFNRSRSDVFMMLTETPYGVYPYAGIPWYSTVFGRDGIITALQTLWFCPEIARGVLNFLAAYQALDYLPAQDAEPGKILHEMRQGEMANCLEIPFGQYYGTVDATPLFVVLAGHYFERTGDRDFMTQLWPHIEQALAWIDQIGDVDGDGFVEYARKTDKGLVNQGWKDSSDSIFHTDGTLAEAPIALCEVQAYVYEAKLQASKIALALDKPDKQAQLFLEAELLRQKFQEAFWCEDLGTYAIALDGDKRPCRLRSSNAGHCLFSGIASPEQAAKIVKGLMDETFFSGWGIRTLASGQVRYNPVSYHNGSIWPHDNALIAAGMGRYGHKSSVLKLMKGLFDASCLLEFQRLPELFCGFKRRKGESPTLYPVACEPQTWAAGAVFMLLQTCLGLSINAQENKVLFQNPVLPSFIPQLTLKKLQVGSSSLDLVLTRHSHDVAVHVKHSKGNAGVVVMK